MSPSEISRACGHATIDPPGPVVAGSYGTWRLSYFAGSRGVSVGGSIRVYTDSDTDWEVPQFLDPSGPDYMTIRAPEGVRTAARVENQRSLRHTDSEG